MAVITISNTGGNFNATGTWVGGVVPLTTDTINATATSGPLTINVASTVAGVDFTNYVSTLAINFAFTITGPIVLVNTMTITGTEYLTASGTSTIRTNGEVIPYLRFVGQNTTRTLLDNITCTNLLQTFGNQNPTVNGATISVSNFRTSTVGGGSYGWLQGNATIIFNGDNCYYENSQTQAGMTNPTFINTTGNFTIAGTGSNSGMISLSTFGTNQAGTSQLIYQNGTVVGALNLSLIYYNNNNTLGIRLDTGSMSSNWNNITIKDGTNITTNANNNLNLTSPLKFNNMYLTAASGVAYSTARRPFRIIGTSVLQGGTFSAQSIMMNNSTTNNQSVYPANIIFTPNAGTTHSFTNLNIVGLPDGKSSISSTTASRVGLSFSNVLLYTDLTGIEATIPSYVYGGTFSNTINIATASFGGSGGGETSATFVN